MNKLILVTVFLTCAAASAEMVHLNNTNVFDLNDDRNSVVIVIDYPGRRLTGLCDIEIRSDRYTPIPLSKLLERVNLNHVFSEKEKPIKSVNHNILRVRLIPDSYLDGFEISTKDGSSLRKTIQDTLGGEHGKRRVIAIARSCPY
ncbi:MAG: hypothetical protein SGI74_05955 [Oligoflexia bacterium]|nr:hypothetical protein [Oligoflexia bacterium]